MTMNPNDDSVSVQLCGMTDAQINAKHLRLRGSMELKYPRRENACQSLCKRNDNPEDRRGDHQCFLAPGHQGAHEFSSFCIAERGQ